MSEFTYRTAMPVSAEKLFAWHAREGAFERLLSPTEDIQVLQHVGGIQDGALLVMRMHVGPVPMEWHARHSGYVEGRTFTDKQIKGPFDFWRHIHAFHPVNEQSSVLEDAIRYRLPMGPLGELVAGGAIAQKVQNMFRFRHARTRQDLLRHEASGLAPMRIAITGASGMIGKALCAFLSTGGHEVIKLVRQRVLEPNQLRWDPQEDTMSAETLAGLEGVDAVIHLAGENIGAGRWTKARMDAIMDSRRVGTRTLCEGLARLKNPPKVLISASGVGYYGDRGNEAITEDDGIAGKNFLAEVCQAWELATVPAQQAGIRVVNARLGIVVSPRGGALAKMLLPFSLGLGGVVGPGGQWMSWIGLDDVLGALLHCLKTDTLTGPVHFTAPQPVTNAEFTRTLGNVLKRPTLFPMPTAAVHTLFGAMGHALLIEGQRVIPGKLLESGFRFQTPYLHDALQWEMGTPCGNMALGLGEAKVTESLDLG